MLMFSNFVDALLLRLCSYGLNIPGAIIVDNSGDLRRPTDVFMGLNNSIKNMRAISTHFVTPFISGITPGSTTLLIQYVAPIGGAFKHLMAYL